MFPVAAIGYMVSDKKGRNFVIGDGGVIIPAEGKKISKSQFPQLYRVLKDLYGDFLIETKWKFAVPDLRSRFK